MAIFRKLYRSLWPWNRTFLINSRSFTLPIKNTRKAIPLNYVIANNPDVCSTILRGNLSKVEWQDVRERMQVEPVTATVVDSIIMDICLKECQVNTAISYFQFLRDNGYPLNVAIIGKYLRLYVYKKDSLVDSDRKEIVDTYDALSARYPYLDPVTAEHCIISLCLTDRWEKTLEIIETMKLSNPPGATAYSALASAAFRNGRASIGWEALSEIALRKLIPQQIAYMSHLYYCEKGGKLTFNDRIEEMFSFWGESSIIPYNHIITAYVDVARKFGWSGKPTNISERGICRHCSQKLSEVTLSEEDFHELAVSIMNKVIIGSDIYHKTNPRELQRFKEFIEKTKPYDVVIDGLNLTYLHKPRSGPSLDTLIKVVEYFKKQGKKILVLSRKHQKKLAVMKYVQQQASVFLTDNLSADDPYLLYATVASGKSAKFVSLDLMRQHKHSLKDLRLQQVFKKWQCSHQYFIVVKSPNAIYIENPSIYLPTAQKNGNCWHVPYVNDDSTYAESYEFPDKWYCLRNDERN